MAGILWGIIMLLFIFWLLGFFLFHLGAVIARYRGDRADLQPGAGTRRNNGTAVKSAPASS